MDRLVQSRISSRKHSTFYGHVNQYKQSVLKVKICWKGTFINYLLLLSDRLRLSRDRERRTEGERLRMEGERRGDPDRPREIERRRGLRLRDLPTQ